MIIVKNVRMDHQFCVNLAKMGISYVVILNVQDVIIHVKVVPLTLINLV